jgi:hypothetical protein
MIKTGGSIMAKTVSMTAEEIRKTEDVDAAFERAKRSKPMPVPSGGGLRVATGFAAFKEHINGGGRSKPAATKPAVKKVTLGIRLPESVVTAIRATDGYSGILSDYIMSGITSGKLEFPLARHQA